MEMNNMSQMPPVSTPPVEPAPDESKSNVVIIILSVIIALLVVAGGVYAYRNNGVFTKSDNDNADGEEAVSSYKTYQNSSGLYNISYPSNWVTSVTGDGIVFSDLGKKEQIANSREYNALDHEIGFYIVDGDPSEEYKNNVYAEENIKIDGINAKRIDGEDQYGKRRANWSLYIIPLNNDKFLAVSIITRDGSSEWFSQSNEVVRSMTVTPNENNVADSQVEDVQNDYILKNALSNMRASAELYLDSHPNYSGLCNTQEEPARSGLSQVKEEASTRPFRCTDGDSFVISVQLYSGEYYCVDSNANYSGLTSSLHTSDSCEPLNTSESSQPASSNAPSPVAIPHNSGN